MSSLRKKYPYFAFLVFLVDAGTLSASFLLAYWFRFSNALHSGGAGVPPFGRYLHAMLIMIPIFLLCFRSYQLYRPERHVRRIQELLNVVKAISVGAILSMALTFAYREFSYSRMMLLFCWMCSVILCGAGRYFVIQLEYRLRARRAQENVLIVGLTHAARHLIRWAEENKHYGQKVIGILANKSEAHPGKHFEGVPILGSLLDFSRLLNEEEIDEVIVADNTIPREVASELMLKCETKLITFKLVADFYGLVTHHVDVEYMSNVPLLGLKELPLDDIGNRAIKRAFDVTVGSIALVVLAPLFFVIAVFVKFTSPGPIFYAQERVGRDERQFRLLKFRTMAADAEKRTGPVWAKPQDDRVTAVGRFLRHMNLDELPQLFNVLQGDMSLVGPRPERPHFVERFRDQIPRYMTRHKIKAGLTGWAQIHGLRGNTSLEERIQYDLFYMENWTLMMDIEILLATLFAFKNAY